MRAEAAAAPLMNMSAPPRSWVKLPRLALDETAAQASAAAPPSRATAVGPDGGRRLSHALCLTQIDLPCAVHAELRLAMRADLTTAPLGLARALVALARRPSPAGPALGPWTRAVRRDIARLTATPEAALLEELCARLAAVAWPAWVPRVAIAIPQGMDTATRLARRPPAPPPGVRCPLLAARLVSAIRGQAFLRDAPPALSNLLESWRGPVASGCWELWLPLRPGHGHAAVTPARRAGDIR